MAKRRPSTRVPLGGYVVLPRRAFHDDPLYQKHPFDDWHAWQDLIIRAAYRDGLTARKETLTLDLARGQLFTCAPELAEAWGWSEKRVRTRLKQWCTERGDDGVPRILCERKQCGTLITVVKYDEYQTPRFYRDARATEFLRGTMTPEKGTQVGTQSGSRKRRDHALPVGVVASPTPREGTQSGSLSGSLDAVTHSPRATSTALRTEEPKLLRKRTRSSEEEATDHGAAVGIASVIAALIDTEEEP